MTKLLLASGDVFFEKITKDNKPSFLQRGINFVQGLYSADGRSDTPHTGIILNAFGKTFESLKKICSKNLFSEYKGVEVEIYRHKDMTEYRYKKGWNAVKHHEGQIYPAWRFVWHTIPFLARFIHIIEIPVCSELVSKFLINAGLLDFKGYMGVNVDELYDHIKNHRDWTLVYKGII